jgi:DNA helicase HerA-like ATPase
MEMRSFDMLTITGAKGSGKTTLERLLLEQYPRVFIFDTLDEFPEYKQRYIPKTNEPAELDAVCQAIYKAGNTMLLVSEAEMFLPVVPVTLPPNVMNIATRGRHRNASMILDTRRIAMLNKTAFSLCEYQFIFRTWSPNDIDYLAKFLPEGEAKKLSALPDYHFMIHHRGDVKIHNPIPFKGQDTNNQAVITNPL